MDWLLLMVSVTWKHLLKHLKRGTCYYKKDEEKNKKKKKTLERWNLKREIQRVKAKKEHASRTIIIKTHSALWEAES